MNTEVAQILLDIKAVSFRLNPPFTYASGILSPIYTDCRLLMSYPKKRMRVIELMAGLVEEKVGGVDVVAGTASAGIPHAAWLSSVLKKPMIYVRKASKDHGRENLIEGVLDKGSSVLVVEDLVSTGASSIRTLGVIREAGGVCENVTSIFTYRLPTAGDNFEKAGVRLHSLCDFECALGLAIGREYLSPDEGKLARKWRENPSGWGK